MRRLCLALALALAVAGCDLLGSDPAPAEPVALTLSPEARTLVGQSNAFGVSLFAHVAAGRDENLMLSPLSASVALTMLLNGTDGETAAQIRDALGLAPDQDLAALDAAYPGLRDQLLAADPKVRFTLANAVFYDAAFHATAPFKAPFLDAMRGSFDARVEALDFGAPAALRTINGWADETTNGRVPKVMDQIDPDLVLVLMNALYFKGDWTTQFEASKTAPAAFRRPDGSTLQVPTMGGEIEALTARGDGYSVLELPYGRRNFSMVVLLPDALPDGTPAPLGGFVERLADGLYADATARLDAQTAWSPTEVRLPRFTFSTDETLTGALQALGMTDAFDEHRADLSPMSDAGLVVSFVKQNTFVEVNEEGTEAAAVTTVGVRATSAGPFFAADRPFVFALRERTTNTLLFLGQVTRPA